jgi:hypothetical protein
MNENNINWNNWNEEEYDDEQYIIISGIQKDGFSIYDYGLMEYFF